MTKVTQEQKTLQNNDFYVIKKDLSENKLKRKHVNLPETTFLPSFQDLLIQIEIDSQKKNTIIEPSKKIKTGRFPFGLDMYLSNK